MNKRMKSVSLAFALLTAGAWTTGAAEAGSSRGASVSRACLTAPARALLSRIEKKFGRVQIVSTCRPGARIAGTGRISRHASGNAIDFHAGSRKGAILKWLIATHRSGGTMTYSHMNHIHVDIGHHFVSLAGRSRVASSRSKWSNRMSLGGPRQRQRNRAAAPNRRSAEKRPFAHGIDEPKA